MEPKEKWPDNSDLARVFDEAVEEEFEKLQLNGMAVRDAFFQSRHSKVVDIAKLYNLKYIVREVLEVPDG